MFTYHLHHLIKMDPQGPVSDQSIDTFIIKQSNIDLGYIYDLRSFLCNGSDFKQRYW